MLVAVVVGACADAPKTVVVNAAATNSKPNLFMYNAPFKSENAFQSLNAFSTIIGIRGDFVTEPSPIFTLQPH